MSRGLRIPGFLLCLLLLAGCQMGRQQVATDDPLRGGTTPSPAPVTGAAASLPAASGPLPAIPAPTGTTSLAALTTVEQSLDSGTPLRIAATPVSHLDGAAAQDVQLIPPQVPYNLPPAPGPYQGSTGFPGPGDDNPVSLVCPVAIERPVSAPIQQPAPPIASQIYVTDQGAAPAGGQLAGYGFAQAQADLLARGATWSEPPHKIADPDEWEFVCSIPDRNDPTGVTFIKFRGFGSGGGGLAAIRNVLANIDEKLPR
jgi:hypothetical protein